MEDPLTVALESIYATAAEPSRWPAALSALADCFADVGATMQYQRDDGSLGTIASPTLVQLVAEFERDEWWRRSPLVTRAIELEFPVKGVRGAVTDRHLVSEDVIATHPYYTDFLASYGLKWFAGITVSPAPNSLAAVGIQRAANKPPYADAELALLDRLGRHIENALRLGVRLLNAEVANLALGEALARVGVGIFLVDASGRITFANREAQQLIGDGLLLTHDRLSARWAGEREALEGAISAILREGAGITNVNPYPTLIHGLDAEGFVAIYVIPFRSTFSEAMASLSTGTRAIIVAIRSEGGQPPDPTIVRDVLGLTLSEARIAALVGSGISPRAAAEMLGITEGTARTTLKRIFGKVGVSRQSELATLLTKLVLR